MIQQILLFAIMLEWLHETLASLHSSVYFFLNP